MPKRDRVMEQQFLETKKRRQRIKLADAPPITSIRDLIEIGHSIKFYKNIDTIMLWRIKPYLEELNNLVGMDTLKESIFDQVLYYIQGMHQRNSQNEYLHTILVGSPGCGKCLGVDTPILLYNGTVKMVQDINTNDILMGDDSSPRNIISTCFGRETLYKIRQFYGDDYIVNESHILSLKLSKSPILHHEIEENYYSVIWFDKYKEHMQIFKYIDNNEDKFIEATNFLNKLPCKGDIIDISISDYLSRTKSWKSVFKGYKVGIEYIKKDIDLDPYILGYWLADSSNKSQFTTIDKEIVEYFSEYFSNLTIKADKSGIVYNIENKHGKNTFISGLKKYNVWNNKHIPTDYKINSRKVRLELLAGLLDSDGYYSELGMYEIYPKNKILANDIVFLARSVGFKSTLTEVDIKSEKYQIIFISGYLDEIPTKLGRKQLYSKKNNNEALMYDIIVEKLDIGDYYGFEIDGNHRFLLGDYTVTHNTTVAQIIGKLYQAMGILSQNGPFKIAHRDDFIAGYLGQTALKTQKLLKSCLGGVLFIDEVYALAPRKDDKDSFSKEALDTLCSFLSEHKNEFCCIAAGYEKDINDCFFAMNQGLKRRFPWVHKIDEYKPVELADIFLKMIKEINWEVSVDRNPLANFIERNKEYFKYSGGDVENFVTKCKIVHSRRVIGLGKEHKFVITQTDLENGIELLKKHKSEEKEDKPPYGMYT